MQNESAIGITRHSGKLAAVSVIMPVWSKVDESDNKIYIDIPLFGLKTVAKDESDFDIAIQEAVMCFCLLSEEKGLGLESELEFNGWEQMDHKEGQMMFDTKNQPVLESVFETGDQVAFELEVN